MSMIEHHGGELTVSSEVIAERTGNEHRAVLQLIRTYREDLADFGRVESEMRPFATSGGTQHRGVFHLNEQQATLILTYMRNMERIRTFKKALVKQFFEMRQALTVRQAPSGSELLALAVLEAQQMLAAKDATIAELTPRADAWDELASAEGDYSVADAAKILCRAGIATGQSRLFGTLHDLGWTFRRAGRWQAAQRAVDAGYLRHRAQSHRHPDTDEVVMDAPQVRLTADGIRRLRDRIRSAEPLPALTG